MWRLVCGPTMTLLVDPAKHISPDDTIFTAITCRHVATVVEVSMLADSANEERSTRRPTSMQTRALKSPLEVEICVESR